MAVECIDHVHIEVADRAAAAAWYARVLGLAPDPSLAVWAEHPMGPLVLAAADGRPALSLFKRDCRPASRDSTIAFRIAGAAFLGFLDALDDLQLQSVQGRVLTRSDLVDHQFSWSLYFLDPDGNRLELTSYDHGDIAQAIGA
jgi:catechol-2,3-dioxygenase